MAAKNPKDALAQEFVILHTAVESFFKGQVVTLEHLKAGLDREIDLARLVRLGAIASVDSEEGKAALAAVDGSAVTPAGDALTAPVPLPIPDVTNTKAADAAKDDAKPA